MNQTIIPRVTPLRFFEAWARACEENHQVLTENWKSSGNYTKALFAEGSIIHCLENQLSLRAFGNYYHTDAVFVDPNVDRVPGAPPNQNWFHNIRIAFEHENAGNWFQEISHLLILRAELRVLVVYPNGTEHLKRELEKLAACVAQSEIGRDPALLIITGWREGSSRIEWQAHTYDGNTFSPLKP